MSDNLPDAEATRASTARGRQPTIYDIAERLGLNPSTVSRALSKPGRVNKATEAKIRATAEELGFRANPMARALQTGKTGTVAVILADITNPVHFDLVRGAEEVTASRDLTLVLAETRGSAESERATIARLQRSVDGILVVGSRLDAESLREISTSTRVVAANHAAAGIPSVFPDMRVGLTAAIDHLRGLGHRSVAYIGGPHLGISTARWELLLQLAVSRSMSIVEIALPDATISAGADALPRVLASGVTAVVAYNDLVAHGLMRACRQRGVEVPLQLSVVGFDDIFSAELAVPALTTIRSPRRRIGAVAMDRLVADDYPGPEPWRIELPTTLIVRESTGAAPVRS